jgi:hypothetical protein
MEETDPLAGEAQAASPAPDQEEVGNVVRFPVATPSETVAADMPPEATSQENPVTLVASSGSAAQESVVQESVASDPLPAELPAEASPEKSETVQRDNVSPDLKDLLEIAAVQAAVDAIVDAAVRGSSTGPDDELD